MGQLIEELATDHEIVSLEEAEVAIDFSAAEAVEKHATQVCELGKKLVIGTTGFDEGPIRSMVEEAQIGCIFSPNFSIGVFRFMELMKKAAELYSDYDVSGFEVHHNQKKDAPSGTMKKLMRVVGLDEAASVRVGNVAGTHTIIFDSPADTIEITHRARSREGFARGALAAAEWIREKVGYFTMEDLFCSTQR